MPATAQGRLSRPSLNRPGGNLTGRDLLRQPARRETNRGGGQSRYRHHSHCVRYRRGPGRTRARGLLHELVPKATIIALLIDKTFAASVAELTEAEAAGRAIGLQVLVVNVEHEREFDAAFATIVQAGAGALYVSGSPLFTSRRLTLVELAARHSIPTIYDVREYAEAGGLISYSASIGGAYRQAGVYAGRILAGAKPSDLPVQQPTKFEFVINLKTAKALGLTVPLIMQMTADDVIE